MAFENRQEELDRVAVIFELHRTHGFEPRGAVKFREIFFGFHGHREAKHYSEAGSTSSSAQSVFLNCLREKSSIHANVRPRDERARLRAGEENDGSGELLGFPKAGHRRVTKNGSGARGC